MVVEPPQRKIARRFRTRPGRCQTVQEADFHNSEIRRGVDRGAGPGLLGEANS
jgi:hypothetical protein